VDQKRFGEQTRRREAAEAAIKVLRSVNELLRKLVEKGYVISHEESMGIFEAALFDPPPRAVMTFDAKTLLNTADFPSLLAHARQFGLECCGVQEALTHVWQMPFNADSTPHTIVPLTFEGLGIPSGNALIFHRVADGSERYRHVYVGEVHSIQLVLPAYQYLFAKRN